MLPSSLNRPTDGLHLVNNFGRLPVWTVASLSVRWTGLIREPRGSASPSEVRVQAEMIPEIPRDQEVATDPFPPRPAHRHSPFLVPEKFDRAGGRFLHGGDEESVAAV